MQEKNQNIKQQGSLGNGQQASQNTQQAKVSPNGQENAGQSGQGIPLSAKGQQLSQQLEQQITQFEQQLNSKSNAEIKQLSEQLETVERQMLLEKVDNELQTIKETVIRPGDIASTAATGSVAAATVQSQQTPVERPDTTA